MFWLCSAAQRPRDRQRVAAQRSITRLTGAEAANITVSRVHGTTLSNIYVPYRRVAGISLVDTPGLRAPMTIAASLGVQPVRDA